MVQFWTHKEVTFEHCCVLQFAYCAVVMAEDSDAMEVLSRKFAAACFLGLFLSCFLMWIWCFATVSYWMRQWLPGKIFLVFFVL